MCQHDLPDRDRLPATMRKSAPSGPVAPGATRRRAMLLGGSALATALGACTTQASDADARLTGQPVGQSSSAAPSPTTPAGTPIGDGSTSDTGPQPNQPSLPSLVAGQVPPQFVVFSWDGAGETDVRLLSRFRQVAADTGASMTLFLSGLYALRSHDAKDYKPPRNAVGRSDIPYLTDASVRRTIEGIGDAWREGHEIGTHFNGHFCAGSGGVDNWSSADWESEIEQAIWMVTHWRTTTGWDDIPSLPFDYRKELIGARTPCLMGQAALIPTAAKLGWRYDSSAGGPQVWPRQFPDTDIWDLPLSQIPFPGHSFQVLAMDYNYMANQSGPQPVKDSSKYAAWEKQAYGALMAGHARALDGNRAPLIVGNHFEQWNGGIYMDAVERAMREMAADEDTYLVSFRQLVDWLDAQDPQLLKALRDLPVGEAPESGWSSLGPA